jgi:hypothetical protein
MSLMDKNGGFVRETSCSIAAIERRARQVMSYFAAEHDAGHPPSPAGPPSLTSGSPPSSGTWPNRLFLVRVVRRQSRTPRRPSCSTCRRCSTVCATTARPYNDQIRTWLIRHLVPNGSPIESPAHFRP